MPNTLPEAHLLHAEISWDFGDVVLPDWRKELTSSDPTASFRLRWRYSGTGFDHAVAAVSDSDGIVRGEVPLPLGPLFADGFRYTEIIIGNLPAAPTVELRVVVKNTAADPLGSPSNSVQISAATTTPFVDVPLMLQGIKEDNGVPGLCGAVWCGQTSEELIWSTGERRSTGGVGAVTNLDRWHIGSNTKALTATVIGWLIQEVTPLPSSSLFLDWDTPLTDIFPEWADEIQDRFRTTTIRHLACHRSGLRMTEAEDAETRALGAGTLNEDPVAGRREMTRRLLIREHEEDGSPTEVGKKWFYGSGNYLVLGAVIEQLTALPYETAMQNLLFDPLSMTTARFGMPSEFSKYQPHGHYRKGDFAHGLEPDNHAVEPVWNPGGGIYLGLSDWLKFCRLHIYGTGGSLTLTPTTLTELHTPHLREFPLSPPVDGVDPCYGWGWGIGAEPRTGGIRLSHDGEYGRFYARHTIHLDDEFAVVCATNVGPGQGYGDLAVGMFHSYLVEKTLGTSPGPASLAGTIPGGSAASGGLLNFPSPENDDRYDLHTILPPPTPAFTLGGHYTLAPLAANDAFARALAAFYRAPRILALEESRFGLWRLRFSSEADLLYGVHRSLTLLPGDWSEEFEITGMDGETTTFVRETPGESAEFFQVRDTMP